MQFQLTLLSNITILISIDHCINVKTTISLLLPSILENCNVKNYISLWWRYSADHFSGIEGQPSILENSRRWSFQLQFQLTLLSIITILISIDHFINVKTTISLLQPSIPETALNSGKVTKPKKKAHFDAQKSECEARRKKSFPESILTPTFCKKRGPNWSNFASVGPFVFYIQL